MVFLDSLMITLGHHSVAALLDNLLMLTWEPFVQSMSTFSFCINPWYYYKLLQLISTATTTKFIKLPQQINDIFDINDKASKFCSGSFLCLTS